VRCGCCQRYTSQRQWTLTELRKGYALLCVSYPRSDLEVETQDEDEVYEPNLVDTLARAKSELATLDEEQK